jgi:hypothetical protein
MLIESSRARRGALVTSVIISGLFACARGESVDASNADLSVPPTVAAATAGPPTASLETTAVRAATDAYAAIPEIQTRLASQLAVTFHPAVLTLAESHQGDRVIADITLALNIMSRHTPAMQWDLPTVRIFRVDFPTANATPNVTDVTFAGLPADPLNVCFFVKNDRNVPNIYGDWCHPVRDQVGKLWVRLNLWGIRRHMVPSLSLTPEGDESVGLSDAAPEVCDGTIKDGAACPWAAEFHEARAASGAHLTSLDLPAP